MKKHIIFLSLLTFVFTSCYPPQIIYSIDRILPQVQEDSIDVKLIKGRTIASGGALRFFLSLDLEISNNKNEKIFVEKKSTLEFRTDSTILEYKISPDSINYQLNKNEKKIVHLNFNATDNNYITYKTRRATNPHELFLFLDLKDERNMKLEKCIVLKPMETRE